MSNFLENPKSDFQKICAKRSLQLKSSGVLTIAVYADFFPVAYENEDGEFVGSDIDLIEKFCEWADLKPVYKRYNKFLGIWNAAAEGTADIAIGGIGITPDRMNPNTEWTIPYFYVDRTLIYNKKHPLAKFPSKYPKNTIIRGTAGSTGWMDGNAKMEKFDSDFTMDPTKTSDEQDIQDLLKGKIQGLMRGNFVAEAIVRENPSLAMQNPWKIEKNLVSSDGECFAFPTKLGSGLAPLLSSFISFCICSGDLKKILKEWNLVQTTKRVPKRKKSIKDEDDE